MGDLFRPKQQQTSPSALEQAAATNAEADRLKTIQQQAEARTAQLFRLFGSRSSFGTGRF